MTNTLAKQLAPAYGFYMPTRYVALIATATGSLESREIDPTLSPLLRLLSLTPMNPPFLAVVMRLLYIEQTLELRDQYPLIVADIRSVEFLQGINTLP